MIQVPSSVLSARLGDLHLQEKEGGGDGPLHGDVRSGGDQRRGGEELVINEQILRLMQSLGIDPNRTKEVRKRFIMVMHE